MRQIHEKKWHFSFY